MSLPSSVVNDALLAILQDRSIHSIPDVIALMRGIEAVLPASDGLRSFNLLYRLVTEEVRDRPSYGWERLAWLDRLDVIFAELYFDGIERCLQTPERAPLSWRALFDARAAPRAPLAFAIAGMSAHINRDLPVAVVLTWEAEGTLHRRRDTPEFRDYARVDRLLDVVEPQAKTILDTGLYKVVDDLLGRADDWLEMRVVRDARAVAWTNAELLAGLGHGSEAGERYVDALDLAAAVTARAALTW